MLVTTPEGTFWVRDLDPEYIAWCLMIEQRAARLVAGMREHRCDLPGPYRGRDEDEALMAEVLEEDEG